MKRVTKLNDVRYWNWLFNKKAVITVCVKTSTTEMDFTMLWSDAHWMSPGDISKECSNDNEAARQHVMPVIIT